MKALDDQERYFVDLVTNGLTCAEAALRAGFPAREAEDIGRILYNRPYIKDALRWKQTEYLRSIGITNHNLLKEYAQIAFFDPADLVDGDGKPLPMHKIPARARCALASFNVKHTNFNGAVSNTLARYKAVNKLPALDSLARVMDMLVDKVEITGANGGPVEINSTLELSDNEKARRVAFLMLQSMGKQRDPIDHED
jgi:phage terminase small subunit